jgi:hypothetical protein
MPLLDWWNANAWEGDVVTINQACASFFNLIKTYKDEYNS